MLSFFRKYQRYLLIIVTVMIIVSFSFFGTYNGRMHRTQKDEVVCTALDGRSLHRSELHQMAFFLSTDTIDKEQYGPMLAANFLNDGVVRKDFFESGLGEQLIFAFINELESDLKQRLDRERRYTPYVHPEARFLNAEQVWSYFAPQLLDSFKRSRATLSIASLGAIRDRIQLYLAEQSFPQNRLKQVLAYQEQQYGWLSKDLYLNRRDLALFGYHTIEEWFGPKFTQLIAQLIINGAALAHERGYTISNEAAEAELLYNAELAFERDRSHLAGVANGRQYMDEQLRVMGMDLSTASRLWRQVMLFRQLFSDIGSSVLVDSFMYDRFNQFSAETVEVELYRLQEQLHLSDIGALERFECYLDAVADRSQLAKPTDLPTQFYSVEEIREKSPELIQRRYLVEVAEAYRCNQMLKVSFKKVLDWELDEKNWALLVERWPELALASHETRKERVEALNGLNKGMRALVDQMAQEAILSGHPEWIEAALDRADSKVQTISLRDQGGPPPLPHVANRCRLKQLLDLAPLPDEPMTEVQRAAAEALQYYSDDGEVYYRIALLDRSLNDEVLTFEEAERLGILEELVDRRLAELYQEACRKKPLEYLGRPLSEMRYTLSSELFEPILTAFEAEAKRQGVPTAQWAATHRFCPHMESVRQIVQKGGGYKWLVTAQDPPAANHLSPATPLINQWHLQKTDHTALRSHNQLLQAASTVGRDPYEMSIGEWSAVFLPDDGRGPCFFQQVAKQPGILLKTSKIADGQRILGQEMQRVFLTELISLCRSKGAICLERPAVE